MRGLLLCFVLSGFILAAGCSRKPQEQAQVQPANPPAAPSQPETPAAPHASVEAVAVQPEAAPAVIRAPKPASKPAARAATSARKAPVPARQPSPEPVTEPAGTARFPESTAPPDVAPAPPAQEPDRNATPMVVPPTSPMVVPPTAPMLVYVTVPSGTSLAIRFTEGIDSSRNKAGDAIRAALDKDVIVDGQAVLTKGSVVTGKIAEVEGAGRVRGRARMVITLTGLDAGGESHAIRTHDLTFEAEGSEKGDAVKVGAAAGIGAIIGAIAGGKKGAAIGGAVGGAAGAGTVLATKGKEVKFEPEEHLTFTLREDMKVRAR